MDRVRDGILVHADDPAAELRDAAPGLVHLLVGHRALHGEEIPADLHVRQTQLREDIEPRDGAGDGNVILLAAVSDVVLGPGRDDVRRNADSGQRLAQPRHALAERIEQRQLDRRLGDLQRYARKARAAANVDDAFVFEVNRVQQRDAVEKVELCHGLRLGDGGQVHDPVFFDQRLSECAERVDLRGRQGGF